MKKILIIAYYELKRNLRDTKMLLIFILSPILLIFILGSSLDSLVTMKDMPTPVVGYVNNDEGDLSETFETFTNQNSIKQIIIIKNYETKEQADEQMNLGNIESVIYIPTNFSSLIQEGEQAQIEVYGKMNSDYVSAIVNTYVKNYNLNTSLINNQMEPTNQFEKVSLERLELNSFDTYPKTMDYYSVQTLLQVLVLCGIFGVSIILRDSQAGISIRINSLPIKKTHLLIGRITGSILYSFLAAITSILFSKYAYHANWNGNMLIIGLAVLLFVVITVGLGTLIGLITKNYISSFAIIGLISFIFSSSVGAFSPKTTIKAIAIFSPNLYAKNIIVASIFKLNHSIIINGFIDLLLMVFIIYSLVFLLERSRKYENI